MRQWLMGVVVGALVGGLVGALVVLLLVPSRAGAAPDEQTQRIPDLIVQRLRVMDVSGQFRGAFEVQGEAVRFSLSGPNGVESVMLLADSQQSVLQTNAPGVAAGRLPSQSAWVGVDANGPKVNLVDMARGRVDAAVIPSRGPSLLAEDSDGAILWSAP